MIRGAPPVLSENLSSRSESPKSVNEGRQFFYEVNPQLTLVTTVSFEENLLDKSLNTAK